MEITAGENKMEENVEFVEVDSVEEFNTLDDMSQQFIKSPKVGEKVEFIVKGFKKITEKSDLEFTFEKNGKQKKASNALSSVDWGIQFITMDGGIFWVNSWSVWGQCKAIAKTLGSNNLNGVELQIDHALNGMLEENRDKAWVVRVKVDGAWKQLDKNTNDWV